MERLLQQFERPVRDAAGTIYNVFLYGRSRPGDTWQGWLVFERLSDGARFETGVETTQSNAEAILYWATGLTDAYFDGALQRAQNGVREHAAPVAIPEPLVGGNIDTRLARLAALERAILDCFSRARATRLLTQRLFDDLAYAHADVVRALEDLEQQGGLLVRRTEEGNDWVFLTRDGIAVAGVPADAGRTATAVVDREPPRLP